MCIGKVVKTDALATMQIMDGKPVFEFKHIACAPQRVQATIDAYSIFFWEVVGTDTSATSHTEDGGLADRLNDAALNRLTGRNIKSADGV